MPIETGESIYHSLRFYFMYGFAHWGRSQTISVKYKKQNINSLLIFFKQAKIGNIYLAIWSPDGIVENLKKSYSFYDKKKRKVKSWIFKAYKLKLHYYIV